MTKKKATEFKVSIIIPDGMTVADMREYIDNAVSSWRGHYEPVTDPRGNIDVDTVKVTRVTKSGKKVFQTTAFEGHYPVGTAAVMVATSAKAAERALNAKLKEMGLPGDAEARFIHEVTDSVDVLLNGDY